MEPKNICIITSNNFYSSAGAEKINLLLYKHFKSNYNSVNLIATKPLKEYLNIGAYYFPIQHLRKSEKHFLWLNPIIRTLRQLNRKQKIDIVVNIGIINENLDIYRFIKEVLEIPVIIYPIGGDYQIKSTTDYGISKNSSIFKNVKKIFNLVDKIVVPGNFMVEEISNCYDVELEKFKIIPNPVDVKYYSEKISFSFKEDYFIYIGRLVEKKGVDILINAFAIALRKGLNASLFIIGYGKEEANLKQLSQDLGVDKKVKFLGEQTGIIKLGLLKGAEAFIAPSRREPYGNTVIEAISAGIPVIVSLKEGHVDIPVKKSGGLFFNNIDNLALILNNREYKNQFEKRTILEYDWNESKILEKWGKVVEDCYTQLYNK